MYLFNKKNPALIKYHVIQMSQNLSTVPLPVNESMRNIVPIYSNESRNNNVSLYSNDSSD